MSQWINGWHSTTVNWCCCYITCSENTFCNNKNKNERKRLEKSERERVNVALLLSVECLRVKKIEGNKKINEGGKWKWFTEEETLVPLINWLIHSLIHSIIRSACLYVCSFVGEGTTSVCVCVVSVSERVCMGATAAAAATCVMMMKMLEVSVSVFSVSSSSIHQVVCHVCRVLVVVVRKDNYLFWFMRETKAAAIIRFVELERERERCVCEIVISGSVVSWMVCNKQTTSTSTFIDSWAAAAGHHIISSPRHDDDDI